MDTGNGMVGPILKEVFSRLPVELIGLYLEPDGNLPNHGLDPLQPENRAELQAGWSLREPISVLLSMEMATAFLPSMTVVSSFRVIS